jgi:hypothetical protein
MWGGRSYFRLRACPGTVVSTALLAVCAFGLMCPSRARAGCGDYVTLGGAHVSPTETATRSPQQSTEKADHPFGQPGPCRGPHCTRGTPQPLVPLASIPGSTNEWGCSLSSEIVHCKDVAVVLAHDPVEFASVSRCAIFHPPRINSSGSIL